MSVGGEFRTAMRKLASTVCIITTADRSGPRALVATSVTSASLDPPAVLFCVNKAASIHSALGAGTDFCVNLLSQADLEIARHVASTKGIERFCRGDWRYHGHSVPWLGSAQACIFASVASRIDWHTHSIILGKVTSTSVKAETSPLLYADGTYRMIST